MWMLLFGVQYFVLQVVLSRPQWFKESESKLVERSLALGVGGGNVKYFLQQKHGKLVLKHQ
jgi:hypothetical protein